MIVKGGKWYSLLAAFSVIILLFTTIFSASPTLVYATDIGTSLDEAGTIEQVVDENEKVQTDSNTESEIVSDNETISTETGANEIVHNPILQIDGTADLTIHTSVPNATSVALKFQTGQQMEAKTLPFTHREGTDNYQVDISAAMFWSPTFSYQIIAESIDGESIAYPENEYIESQVYYTNEPDSQAMPKLMITEIVPDTDNIGGLDAYEFIEIYNNTNQPINMKDYGIIYRYPDNTEDQNWDLTEDKIVGPMESFVVWIHNGKNNDQTIEDFNAKYGLQLTESHVTIIENAGMANSAQRTLVLVDKIGNEISEVTYNDGQKDTVANKGIIYKYPQEGKSMRKVGLSETMTPLEIIPGQVPSKPVVIETTEGVPVIGQPSISVADEQVTVKIDVTSEQDILGVNLHVSQSKAMDEQVLPMQVIGDTSTYTLTIPRNLIWSERIEYYFVASNAADKTTTETFEINIPQSEVNTQTVPKLLITELIPNTVNMNGADAYEFIEIYNNTNQPINTQDYKLIYRYPTSTPDQIWDITDDKVIAPQESFIVWIHNAGNKSATLDDFNAQYGLNLTEDRVAIIESEGMANSSERTLVLTDKFNNVITEASYNNGSNDNVVDRSVIYKYPTEGHIMQKVGIAKGISPLTVFPEQVPSEPVKLDPDGEPPVIGSPKLDLTDEQITVQVKISSEQPVMGVNLMVSQSEALDYKQIPLVASEEDSSLYTVTIPRGEILSHTIQYYLVASNQAGETKTKVESIEIPLADIDYQAVPPLLITEIVPDSANANGADAYEFIEVYNNTTEDINYQDYTIRYRYPNTGKESDLLWGPPVNGPDIIIPSGETVVFWIINAGNTDKTGVDFNAHYQSNLEEGKNLIKIYNNGMSNSAQRTLIMATKTGYELSYASFFDEAGVDDTLPDKGILYRYPVDGSLVSKKISYGELDATPGTFLAEQVPAVKVQLPADTQAPVITDKTNKDVITSEQPVSITANITDNVQVKSVSLYYRTVAGEDFREVSLERGAGNTYQHIVYEPELIGQKKLEYYFVARDGKNEIETERKAISIEHPNMETGLRLNVDNHELLSGEKVIKATEDKFTKDIELFIDENKVTDTFMAMENEAHFAFDVSETNIYFQNGVTMGDEILEIFDDTHNNFVTITVPIPADKLAPGENTITIRSGNKVSPFDETSTENRDDFTIKNVRLVLSDGTIIYDPNYSNPEKTYAVGDSTGKKAVLDFNFTLESESFSSLAYLFNTTAMNDGEHQVKATLADEEVSVTVITDNTVPSITATIEDGKQYKGKFTIDAEIKDANEITEVTSKLDGKSITLPYETSSATMAAGQHEVVITATDAAGNVGTKTITFTVVEENPLSPEFMESDPSSTNVKLSVKVEDPTGDAMDIAFYEGYQYTAVDTENIVVSHNTVATEPPRSYLPEGEMKFTEAEYSKISKVDGEQVSTESTTEFPYHRFDITVDEKVQPDDEIEIVWDGSSLNGRKVTMYAWNHKTSEWDVLVSTIAGDEDFQLIGTLTGEEYNQDNKISVIVQDQIAEHGEDFSFVWMSDTQYYSESFPHIYTAQVNWIKENQDALNIEYVFHTGDLVNIWDDFKQWQVADESMKVLDNAGIPYGVLAGNHDVDQKGNNYANYYTYFGDDRFANNEWFGGSYKNNRGHYDLISVNGNDFIMVYMGWGVDQEGIDWVNHVLKEHPNHKAILSFHEYLLASGTRSPIGDEIFEKIVIPNETVMAVLSGHYHNAQTLIDELDDNGDGISDRTVYQMLADYQDGPEGGQGYLRILNFNMGTNTMDVQTYSPYLDKYNYYDPAEYPGKDEFTVDWDTTPQVKKVATDSIEINVYTNQLIGKAENVASGELVTMTWNDLTPNTEYFWNVVATDQYEGKVRSNLASFTTEEPGDEETNVAEKLYNFKSFKTNQLTITKPSVSITLDQTSEITNGVVFTGDYAEFHGEGFANTTVTIKPDKAGAIVDFKGTKVQKVMIDGTNVAEIRGARNVEFEYVNGARQEAIKNDN